MQVIKANKKINPVKIAVRIAITRGILNRRKKFSIGCSSTAIKKAKPKGKRISCPI